MTPAPQHDFVDDNHFWKNVRAVREKHPNAFEQQVHKWHAEEAETEKRGMPLELEARHVQDAVGRGEGGASNAVQGDAIPDGGGVLEARKDSADTNNDQATVVPKQPQRHGHENRKLLNEEARSRQTDARSREPAPRPNRAAIVEKMHLKDSRNMANETDADRVAALIEKRFSSKERANRMGKPGPGYINCSDPAVMMQFVVHPEHANGMQNRGVRMLAGATLSGTFSNKDARTVAEMYVDAVRELNALDSIIVMEEYGLSLAVMASKFLVAPPRKYEVVREATEVGKGYAKQYSNVPRTPDIIDAVKKGNALDIALYALAKERLEAEGKALFGVKKMKSCTSYTCKKLNPHPRSISDDLNQKAKALRAGNRLSAYLSNQMKRQAQLYSSLGYVITATCTADFRLDDPECFGAVGSRWWD